jgi:hypothetical protein
MFSRVLLKNWSDIRMVSSSMIFLAPTGTALGTPSGVAVESTTVETLSNNALILSVICAIFYSPSVKLYIVTYLSKNEFDESCPAINGNSYLP